MLIIDGDDGGIGIGVGVGVGVGCASASLATKLTSNTKATSQLDRVGRDHINILTVMRS